MTTLNTIIEEEVEAYKNDYAQAITDVGGFGLAKHIDRFLTTAMQRAYEAAKVERDTYWKEQLQKAREEALAREKQLKQVHMMELDAISCMSLEQYVVWRDQRKQRPNHDEYESNI